MAEKNVYRVVNGVRYSFPDEEKARVFDSAYTSLLQKYAEEESIPSQIIPALKSVVPGMIRGTAMMSTGIGSLFQSEGAKQFGETLSRGADIISDKMMKPYQRYTTLASLGETAGAMTPAAIATAASLALAPEAALAAGIAGGAVGGLQSAGEIGQDIAEARARGAQITPEAEQRLAATYGGLSALLEGSSMGSIAKGARSLALGRKLASEFGEEAVKRQASKELSDLLAAGGKDILLRAGKSALQEGATEGAQQVLLNTMAREYDPNRDITQGVGESVFAGAALGGVLGGGIDLYRKKKLEGILDRERERRKEGPTVPQNLEDALVSTEIEGQQREDLVAGVLSEQRAKALDEALTSAMSTLVDPEQLQQKIASDLFGSEYNLLDKKQSRKVDERLKKELPSPFQRMRAYQEIAARDQFGKLYSELSDAKADESDKSELDIANEFARDLFQRRVDPNSIAIGIQVKEREAPGAVETKPQPPIETGPVFSGDLPESEIARLQEEDRKDRVAQAEAILKRPIKAPTSKAYIDAEGRVIEPGPVLYQDIQRQKYVPEPVIEGSLEAEKAKGLPGGRLSEEGVFVPDNSLEYEAEAQQRIDDRLQPESILGQVVQATDQQIGQRQESLKQAYEPAPPPSMEQIVEATAEMPRQIEIEEAQAAEDRQFSRYKKFDRDEYRSVLEGLKSTPDAAISSSYLAKNFGLTPPAANSMMSLMRSRGDIKESDGKLFVNPEAEGPMYKLRKRRGTPPAAAVTATAPVQPERGTPIPTVPRLNLDVEAARKVSSGAYQQLRKLNVSDLYSLVVVDNFLTDKGEVDPAGASFLNNVIKLASKENNIAESEENLINTVNHEVVHGMRKSGFFSDAQWNLLTAKFTPQGELDQETIAAYQSRFKNETPERLNEILKEEAVAHAIERLGKEPAKPLSLPEKTLMQKVKDLARIGTSANNLGYTAEDLISAVRAGDVGRRAIPGERTTLQSIKERAKRGDLEAPSRADVSEFENIPEEPEPVGLREAERRAARESRVAPGYESEEATVNRAEESEPEPSPVVAEDQDETETQRSMYKLIPQAQPELFEVSKNESVLDMIANGFRTNSWKSAAADVMDYALESKAGKAIIGPKSGMGKTISVRQRLFAGDVGILKNGEMLHHETGDSMFTDATSSAIAASRQAQKQNELLSQALEEGYIVIDKDTGWWTVVKSKDHAIMPHIRNLAEKGKLYLGFEAGIARRKVEAQKVTGNADKILGGDFTLQDAIRIDNKYKGDQDIQRFLEVYKNFNNSLVYMNKQAGNFDQDTVNRLVAWYYSSYYRMPVDKDGQIVAPTVSSAKIANLKGLTAIKGSKERINDALENFITNAQFMVGYAMNNHAAQRVVRDLVYASGIQKPGTETAIAIEVSSPDKATNPDQVIRINVNGKPKYYEIPDPVMYNSIMRTRTKISGLGTVSKGFTSVFRAGITTSINYVVGNLRFDSLRLWFYGIYDGLPIYSIPKNLIQGAASVLTKDKYYTELLNAGLIANPYSARDAVRAANKIRASLQVDQNNAIQAALSKYWDLTVGKVQDLSAASEAVNRVQVYKNVYKKMLKAGQTEGGARAAALFASMEYPVNFDVHGDGAVAQYASAYLPFVTSQITGLDVFARQMRALYHSTTGKRKPTTKLQEMMVNGMKRTITESMIFGFIYTFMMATADDDSWRKATPEERYKTVFIPLPGAPMGIPIPEEIGAISLLIPSILASELIGEGKTGMETAKSVVNFLTGIFTFDPTPQFIKPTLEVATNKNFYTWRSIEDESMRKLMPEYRYDERTSLLGKALGEYASKAALPVSPVQFDHLIRGYFGTLGVFTSDVISYLFDVTKEKEPERWRLEDPYLLPGVGRLFVSPQNRNAVEDYYAIRNAAVLASNSIKGVAAGKLYEEDPEKLRQLAILDQINKAMDAGPEKEMQKLRKLKREALAASPDQITPSRKRDILKQIDLRINDIAKGVQPLKQYVPFTWF